VRLLAPFRHDPVGGESGFIGTSDLTSKPLRHRWPRRLSSSRAASSRKRSAKTPCRSIARVHGDGRRSPTTTRSGTFSNSLRSGRVAGHSGWMSRSSYAVFRYCDDVLPSHGTLPASSQPNRFPRCSSPARSSAPRWDRSQSHRLPRRSARRVACLPVVQPAPSGWCTACRALSCRRCR
jgi:hypothetical protein